MNPSNKRAYKINEFVAHELPLRSLALGHKSGRVLATGGCDTKVNLWAIGQPHCIISLPGHQSPVGALRFGHSDELILTGTDEGVVNVWDLEPIQAIRSCENKSPISSLDLSATGTYIACGTSTGSIKLWDTRTSQFLSELTHHSKRITCLRFSPDNKWLASASEDCSIKLWDLNASKMAGEFRRHSNTVTRVEFHPSSPILTSCSLDRTIKYWDLNVMDMLSTTAPEKMNFDSMFMDHKGSCVYAAYAFGLKILTWDPVQCVDQVQMDWRNISDMALAQQQLIAASFLGRKVSVYNVDLKRCNTEPKPYFQSEDLSDLNPKCGVIRRNKSIKMTSSSNPAAPAALEQSIGEECKEEPGCKARKLLAYRRSMSHLQGMMAKSHERQALHDYNPEPSNEERFAPMNESVFSPSNVKEASRRTQVVAVSSCYSSNFSNFTARTEESSTLLVRPIASAAIMQSPPHFVKEAEHQPCKESSVMAAMVKSKHHFKTAFSSAPRSNNISGANRRIINVSSRLKAANLINATKRSATSTIKPKPQLIPFPSLLSSSARVIGAPQTRNQDFVAPPEVSTTPSSTPSPTEEELLQLADCKDPLACETIFQPRRSMMRTPPPPTTISIEGGDRGPGSPSISTLTHTATTATFNTVVSPFSTKKAGLTTKPVVMIRPSKSHYPSPHRIANNARSLYFPSEEHSNSFNAQNRQGQAESDSQSSTSPADDPMSLSHRGYRGVSQYNNGESINLDQQQHSCYGRSGEYGYARNAVRPYPSPGRRPTSFHDTSSYHAFSQASAIDMTASYLPTGGDRKVKFYDDYNANHPNNQNCRVDPFQKLDDVEPTALTSRFNRFTLHPGSGGKMEGAIKANRRAIQVKNRHLYFDTANHLEQINQPAPAYDDDKGGGFKRSQKDFDEHEQLCVALDTRLKNLKMIGALLKSRSDMKIIVEMVSSLSDDAAFVDVLTSLVNCPRVWTLDISMELLPRIQSLLNHHQENYITLGCKALKVVLKNFGQLIKSSLTLTADIGVDLNREERYKKCQTCFKHLTSIKCHFNKSVLFGGKLGREMKEVQLLLETIE